MFFSLKKVVFFLLLIAIGTIQICHCVEIDLSIYVEPGEKQCFFQFITQGTKYETEYQVIEGGELDLNFVISSPTGKVLVSKIRSTEAMHRGTAEEEGDHQFCLDNSFSRFSRKLVFFEILTDDEDEDDEKNTPDLPVDDTLYDMKMEDIKEGLDTIKNRLDKSREILRVLKAIEARDRSMAEDNFSRVNFWSGIQLFIMLSVGLVQVLMIRGFFEQGKNTSSGFKMRT